MAQFPANYPEELKQYGYPPPFPAGCPPQDHYYSPISSPMTQFPPNGWETINIAGNLFSSCSNTNKGNGIQENGDVKFSNHYEENYGYGTGFSASTLNAYGGYLAPKQINISGHLYSGCDNVNFGSQKNGDLEIGNYTKKNYNN